MASRSKIKGSRVEREIVKLFTDRGYEAKKVPLSGACAEYKGDIDWKFKDRDIKIECKARKDGTGFKVLDNWMGDNDILVLKKDRTPPNVYMSLETFFEINKYCDELP